MPDPTRLSLLALPRYWHGDRLTLDLAILALPGGHPLRPLAEGQPAFADATLRFSAEFLPGLGHLPLPGLPTQSFAPTLAAVTPSDRRALYEAMNRAYPIGDDGPPPDPPHLSIRKFLPPSYQNAFAFGAPRTPQCVTGDEYACAVRNARITRSRFVSGLEEPTWGRVLALALRRPPVATRLGLRYDAALTFPDEHLLDGGGWLYITLAADSDYAAAFAAPSEALFSYAARLPALGTFDRRQVFSAVLIPIQAPVSGADTDAILAEAAEYDDGFAKIVHTIQEEHARPLETNPDALPPVGDGGIRIGWDDEQVTIWMNRQVGLAPGARRPAAVMGVARYCIDVQPADPEGPSGGGAPWTSLHRVAGRLAVDSADLGDWSGEAGIEPAPAHLDDTVPLDTWLPAYFASWRGTTIGIADETAIRLQGRPADAAGLLHGVGQDDVPLRYGHSYRFRVRLMDLAGQAPDPGTDSPIAPAPAPTALHTFRRVVPPRALGGLGLPVQDPPVPPTSLRLYRPLLGYPAAVFTGFPGAREALVNDLAVAAGEDREVGIPDPDVTLVEVRVAVEGLGFDPGDDRSASDPFHVLYMAIRTMPADPAAPLDLAFAFVDVPNVAAHAWPAGPGDGPIPLPTGRTCRVTCTALGGRGPDYFASEAARRGPPTTFTTRQASQDERGLFRAPAPADPPLRAIILQPDPAPNAVLAAALKAEGKVDERPAGAIGRLAAALRLPMNGHTLGTPLGRRVVFGAAAGLRHALAPDHGSITFMAADELTGRWLVVVMADVNRDWSWDALSEAGILVRRSVGGASFVTVGALEPQRSANAMARQQPDRSFTRLVFIDVIDVQLAPGETPAERSVTYELAPQFRDHPGVGPEAWQHTLTLPMAVPPQQTPRIVSAGIALSPYSHDPGYRSTADRERALLVEMAEPLANPRDAYYARVLALAPDPLLTGLGAAASAAAPEPPVEPALPIDPEPIRIVTEASADDGAGLGAMQELIATDSPRHFLVPLPPGIEPGTRELFGMLTYEFRVGHAQGWSTAQGRYGAPLRVTGVQHPAPPLACSVDRQLDALIVRAPFASPVDTRRDVAPDPPSTGLWVVLYAQVMTLDGARWQNVLLDRRAAPLEPGAGGGRTGRATWREPEIQDLLAGLGLDRASGLSVLAVETIPPLADYPDPLGADLGKVRILRTSPLTPVPAACD